MKLICHALHDFAPRLAAARPQRDWMDAFPERHPYRCLPLTIANAHGWDVLCPVPLEIEWNGGPALGDLTVRALKPLPGGRPVEQFCQSHFARGIVTFQLDYIFRTETGWDLLATGPFNRPKDNATALTGIMETDWSPYPFTMNWQILRPGKVRFQQDEPFCFLFPIAKQALLECTPEIVKLEENDALRRDSAAFGRSRGEFLGRLNSGDPGAAAEGWQKDYFLGRKPGGGEAEDHLGRLRLREPIDRRLSVAAGPKRRVPPKGIDDSGRLGDWSGTRVIWSAADADGTGILVADAQLDAAACREMAESERREAGSFVAARRAFSRLIFLNDDYDGGELYLPRLDLAIKPRRGMLVGLTDREEHEHAFLRVEWGTALVLMLPLETIDWSATIMAIPHG